MTSFTPVLTYKEAEKQYIAHCQGFTKLPSDIPKDAEKIDINGHQIKTLGNNTFNYPSCLILNVQYVQNGAIENIEVGAFNNLEKLEVLGLHKNKIKTLAPGVFSGLSSLITLWLTGNDITYLEPGVFEGLVNLQYLKLFRNYITHVDAGTFQGLVNLKTLELSINAITHLHAEVFQGLVNMEELNLYENDISNLDAGIFQGMTKLWALALHDNNIEYLPPGILSNLPKLKMLSLMENKLTTLHQDVFSFESERPSYFDIGLSDNPLTCNTSLCWLFDYATAGWLTFNSRHIGFFYNSVPACTGSDIAWSTIYTICGEEGR